MFSLPYVQRGLLEVLALAVCGGLLGTWIVLRGLAFFAHAVGTATFPGLVVADGLGFAAPLGALAIALLFTAGVASSTRRQRAGHATATGLVLVACLAAGAILASDVFRSGANVETLLFGSLLLIGPGDVGLAAGAALVVVAASLLLGRRWLAVGFDPEGARALGLRSSLPDLVLLGLVALATVAALSAVGALLTVALFVVPAATVRLLTDRLGAWQLGAVGLCALEGVAGLWLSVRTDAPPGATIGVISAALFAAAGLARIARRALPVALAGVAAAALLAGCGGGAGGGGGDRVQVVATTTQLGDLARQVGGDAAEVTQILQPNTDPHDYEPRPSDVRRTAEAQVVLESGDELDHWMGRVVEQSGTKARVVDVGSTVPVRLPGESTGPEASRYDPHWWHDPVNAQAAVRTIARALAQAAPERRATFEANARRAVRRLERLDRGIAACVARIPPGQRKLVTDHDAFGYFARRYNIEVVGAVIPSQTTQAQPSAGDVSRLVALIRRERVRAVFPESSINPRLAQAIADETGATATYTLYGDTLGPPGSPGATYAGMEQANADAIVAGLTGGAQRCRIPGLR